MLVPSNATEYGPVPTVTVAVTKVETGSIFDTVPESELATQMLVPSNATPHG
ncbi:unannotated protein [freshwater metagenome]|uniref:Unannotated protein n=1 Tax=freshwater metagenome TaxID=449393 RepID=A0A6J7QSG3_9ZZZZ